MTVLDKARMFIVKQRIIELKRAIEHWPDSPKLEERKGQLEDLEEELALYNLNK